MTRFDDAKAYCRTMALGSAHESERGDIIFTAPSGTLGSEARVEAARRKVAP